LNDSSFRALCKFAARSIDTSALREVLEEVSARIHAAGDRAQARKLADQTRDAFSFVARQRASEILLGSGSSEAQRAQSKWPQPEFALIDEINKKFASSTLFALSASSASGVSAASEVLPLLFPANSFICSAPKKDEHFIFTLEETCPRAIHAQYMVPNRAAGPAQFVERLGHVSAKFSENFPKRRFLVVEFDFVKRPPYDKLELEQKLDLQAALHTHLREFGALVLVVFSGNASLHGWYTCVGASEDEVREFLTYACCLGADPALFSMCQLTRMPGGTHANGKRQEVVFFAPEDIDE
jgi:hypothetical protein